MSLITNTGIITRALPIATGLEIKLLCKGGGTVTLEIAGRNGDLIDVARNARMSGEEMLVRHTYAGMAVAVQSTAMPMAA